MTVSSIQNKIIYFSDEQKKEDVSECILPPEMIERVLELLTFEKLKEIKRVCKQWELLTENVQIKQRVSGSDQWNAFDLELLPRSIIPQKTEGAIKLVNKRCPFDKNKLFIDTHIIAYIGKEFRVLINNGNRANFPNNINLVNTIFGQIFCLYNVHAECNIWKNTVKKTKWIAFYKDAINVFRKDGKEIELSKEDEKRIKISKQEGYRTPTLFEYGFIIAGSYFKNRSKKCTTWLTEGENRHAMSSDVVKNRVGNRDHLLIQSDGRGVVAQCQKMDIYTTNYLNTETFGTMVCVELSPQLLI